MDLILPLNLAYDIDSTSWTSPSSKSDTNPALFDLPYFRDEPPVFMQSALACDLGSDFEDMGEYLNGTDIDRMFAEQELDKQAQSDIAKERSNQETLKEKRSASQLGADDRPIVNSDIAAAPATFGDVQAQNSSEVRSSSVARDMQSSAPVPSASKSGVASYEALLPEQDPNRDGDVVEIRSDAATEALGDVSSPRSLSSSRAVHSSSIPSGARSSICIPTTLAADEEASSAQTTDGSENGRAVAGSKRKYSKRTLISKSFRQKQDAALQVAWVEAQSIWLCLRPLLQKAEVQDSALQPHTSALNTKFQNLCTVLLGKECVDDAALVLDVVSAWRTVQELLSLEHDPQNVASQFARQLGVFQEKVDLQIDIGKCLDEEQARHISQKQLSATSAALF
ncbi:hypothetical protein E8E11_000860 [Didymella keratinophila]|nr:hypothetical protein E8E11_000860 [Didymella keratinophila]